MNNINIICVSENKKRYLCINKKSHYCIADENFNIILETEIIEQSDYIECISKSGDMFALFNTDKRKLSIYDSQTGNEIYSIDILDLYSYYFFNDCSLFIIEYIDINCYILSMLNIKNGKREIIYKLKNVCIGDYNFYNNSIFLVYKNLDSQEIKYLELSDFGNDISLNSLKNLFSKKVNPLSIRFNDDCSKIIYINSKYFLRKSDIILIDINKHKSRKLLSVPFKKIKPINLALNLDYLSEQYFSFMYDDELCVYDISNSEIAISYRFNNSDSVTLFSISKDVLILNHNNKIVELKLK